MSGLSTIGIISLGLALVAGRNRLPMPATGNTALVSRVFMVSRLSWSVPPRPREREQARLVKYRDSQFQGTIILAPGTGARDQVVGLPGHRSAHPAACRFDQRARLLARHRRQRSRQHEDLACEHAFRLPRRASMLGPAYTRAAQLPDHVEIVPLGQELPDRHRDHG